MVFSSALFLVCFLPVFILVYVLLPVKFRNAWLLIASLIFYAWGAPLFIILVVISIITDYYLVKSFPKFGPKHRKILAGLAIGLNISLLAYFKYANFFIDNIGSILETFGSERPHWIGVALPIGISFLTFQKITFIVDVYRGGSKVPRHLGNYALYVLMFPQLIAGPIVRFHEIEDQLNVRSERAQLRLNGFYRFCFGLARKVLIADTLAPLADAAFSVNPQGLDSFTAWLGLLAYTFQIYHDFAGYSDMAIGLGRMMGFELPENFRNPYISSSITEFWRRWHMSLGRFMRDYLYIPLGGNRGSLERTYFNLFVVFLISGLWHGAAWTFVIWGAWHGLFLVLERLFLLRWYQKLGRMIPTVFTFFIAIMGWVLFRSDDWTHATGYFQALLGLNVSEMLVLPEQKQVVFIILAAVVAFIPMLPGVESWQERMLVRDMPAPALRWQIPLALLVFYLSLASVLASGFHPFIYFRF